MPCLFIKCFFINWPLNTAPHPIRKESQRRMAQRRGAIAQEQEEEDDQQGFVWLDESQEEETGQDQRSSGRC